MLAVMGMSLLFGGDNTFGERLTCKKGGIVSRIVTWVCAVALKPEGSVAETVELTNALKTFDEARTEGFELAGMTKTEDVKFTRVDPETGTVVEFKGPDGAKVRYDAPHPETPGPAHDQQHVSWQSAGKTSQGGRKRGNIPYGGTRHPSATDRQTGNVEPH
jgi:hypothetical protein